MGRDEFSPTTRMLLAQRAGFICAYPGCRQLTVGPSEDRQSGLTMVGIAAHITAASARGPRFDPLLTPEERASEANGILMCALHAKLIDNNASAHTIAELRRWKAQHEEWVFARVAAADSAVKHGITRVVVQHLGPFRQRATVLLGRHNVIFGDNGAGKSTFCEIVAAFAGGINFDNFKKHWRLFGPREPSMVVEASVSVGGTRRTVRLSEEAVRLGQESDGRQSRLHIQVDGNVAVNWPQSLFNVIYLSNERYGVDPIDDHFRRQLRALAPQLGMGEDDLWDSFREEMFCSSTFGTRIRRVREYGAEIKSTGSKYFFDANAVATSELIFALFDITLKMIRSDPRRTPWMLIVDSSLFLGLDSGNKRHLVEQLARLQDPDVQTIVCLNTEDDAAALKAPDGERWAGSSVAGELTVHAFL